MLKYLKGRLIRKEDSSILIESGNFGIHVNFPTLSMQYLGPIGSEIKIYTELYVKARENDGELVIYGFLNEKELELFRLLVTVNKVGPKLALGILSQLTYDQIIESVLNSNWKFLSSVNGLGKKTSERLIVDLKDKVSSMFGSVPSKSIIQESDDLRNALISLGIREQEINLALKKMDGKLSEEPLEEQIKIMLRAISNNE